MIFSFLSKRINADCSALASIGSAEAVESTSESPSIGRDQPAATDTPEESPASKPEESG